MKESINVCYSGWFWFCPVWLPEPTNYCIEPIPKLGMWWLLDAALMFQQGMNWVISIFAPDACGFLLHHVRMIKPRTITFDTEA